MAAAADNESLGAARLDDAARDSLIQQETECVFVFSGSGDWPSGVVMSYIFADGAFWLTSVLGRRQVTGARADPRVTIVISNHGADSRQMISVRAPPPLTPTPRRRTGSTRCSPGGSAPPPRTSSEPCWTARTGSSSNADQPAPGRRTTRGGFPATAAAGPPKPERPKGSR